MRAFPSNFTISSGTAAGGHQGVCRTGNPLVTCETDREAGPCGTRCRRITEPGNKLSSSHRIPRRTSGARTWVKRFSDDHWYFFLSVQIGREIIARPHPASQPEGLLEKEVLLSSSKWPGLCWAGCKVLQWDLSVSGIRP